MGEGHNCPWINPYLLLLLFYVDRILEVNGYNYFYVTLLLSTNALLICEPNPSYHITKGYANNQWYQSI